MDVFVLAFHSRVHPSKKVSRRSKVTSNSEKKTANDGKGPEADVALVYITFRYSTPLSLAESALYCVN